MKTYSQYLTESKSEVNAHLEHLEDMILNQGYAGAKLVLQYLSIVRDELAGHSAVKVKKSQKWDGAPAVIFGTDPTNGKFFVAKKGIFNKNPKVYKTDADIDEDTSGDLNAKLKLALKHFPKLGIKGIVQGDFLFAADDIQAFKYDGVDYVSFHPNTIVYAAEAGSELAKRIKKAKVGVVLHTVYSGKSFDSLKATFAQKIPHKQSPDVFVEVATIEDISGAATLTKDETDTVNKIIAKLQADVSKVSRGALNEIHANEELLIVTKLAINNGVRSGKMIGDPAQFVTDLIQLIKERGDAAAAKLKTERGKAGAIEKTNALLAYFNKHDRAEIASVINMLVDVVQAKEILLTKLNSLSKVRSFVATSDGYRATSGEGFVIADHMGKNAVKLVDRLEFSRNNFDPSVIKGFQRPNR